MRKRIYHLFLISVCLCIVGCAQSNDPDIGNGEGGENTMTQKDILEFKNIDKAPEATEAHPINEVIKVFFTEWSIDVQPVAIAIDLENSEIYQDPAMGRRGLRARGGVVPLESTEDVVGILEKYHVQDWEKDYTFEDPASYEDGYSWQLWLQYEDGSVEKHRGEGTDKEKLTPGGFDEFVGELSGIVEESLAEK